MTEFMFRFKVSGEFETRVVANGYDEAYQKATNNYMDSDFGVLSDIDADIVQCQSEPLYEWGDLCRAAEIYGGGCIRVRDTARCQIADEIFDLLGYHIEDTENPDEEVEDFLKNNPEYLFDSFGNITEVDD